jgi:hypothetical protein
MLVAVTSDEIIYTAPFEPERRWPSISALAQEWWVEEPFRHLDPQPELPAHGCVDDMLHDSHPECVALLVALVERAPDDDALASLGAGPLEDLISHYRHGPRWLDAVEAAARRDPRFATAVRGMWLGADVSIEVRRRHGANFSGPVPQHVGRLAAQASPSVRPRTALPGRSTDNLWPSDARCQRRGRLPPSVGAGVTGARFRRYAGRATGEAS